MDLTGGCYILYTYKYHVSLFRLYVQGFFRVGASGNMFVGCWEMLSDHDVNCINVGSE